MHDIITVGSATVDVFAYTDRSEVIKIESKGSEEDFIAYPSGTKVLLNKLFFSTGGGGTNTAIGFSRLGLKTAFLGCLGYDDTGKRILEALKREKVNFTGCIDKKEPSGFSIILDSIEHDRTILVFLGANKNLEFSKINLGRIKTKWFYFSSMIDKSFKTLEKLSDYAKKQKIKVAFNTGSYLVSRGKKFLSKLLTTSKVLILNKEEAQTLAGNFEIKKLLIELKKFSPEIVAITNGAEGAYAFDGKKSYFAKAHDIKVVETTGAGDAFASGFLAGLIKKNNIEFALRLGIINAESVLSYYGAKNKLLKWNEAVKAIKKNPVKIKMKTL